MDDEMSAVATPAAGPRDLWARPTGAAETSPMVGPQPIAIGQGAFKGGFWQLAWLMLRGVFLTVITLGFYRFWMRTQLRRYYWNSLRIDGEPFEYTGRALEMLLGFLIAIFFLAIYLFLVSAVLSTYSLAYFQSFELILAAPLLVVVPLVPFAKYRAQRYLLSRTRFRGICFGLAPGAWAYAGRSLIWTLGIICTLGLLWPVADFHLRRFVTRRTYFGDQRLSLEGRPGQLIGKFFMGFVLPVVLLFAIAIALSPAAFWAEAAVMDEEMALEQLTSSGAFVVAVLGTLMFWSVYQANRLRFFLNRTHVGEDLILSSALSPAGVVGRAITGYFLTSILVAIIAALVIALAFNLFQMLEANGYEVFLPGAEPSSGGAVTNEDILRMLPFVAVVLGAYLIIYITASAISEVLVSRRIFRHIASTLTIEHFDRVASVRQREEDHSRSADGFADALDVGPI